VLSASAGSESHEKARQARSGAQEQNTRGQDQGDTGQEAEKQNDGHRKDCIYDLRVDPPGGGEFELYCRLVQEGRLYDFLVDELLAQGYRISREQLKKRFLTDVIAKKKANRLGAEYPSPAEDAFARLFPTVYRFIRNVNRNGWEHKNLIRDLQREESRLVIETVCQDLVERYPEMFLITIHDSILCLPEHVGRVERAFHTAFAERGFPMRLKVTH
jgi:hypothetical protein